MKTLRAYRRRIAWLALLSMLTIAWMPTLSHALASSRDAAVRTEVCTAQGLRLIQLDLGPAEGLPAPATSPDHLAHCPFCVQSFGALGMPPSPAAVPSLPVARAQVPALFLHAPVTLHAWRRSQPRAPPVDA